MIKLSLNWMQSTKIIFIMILLLTLSCISGGFSFTETMINSRENVYRFIDVPSNHWASNSVVKLQARNVISEVPNGLFFPGKVINREDFVVLLMKSLGLESNIEVGSYIEATKEIPSSLEFRLGQFWDISADSINHKYLSRAITDKIISGTSKTFFSPYINITREQVSVILANAINKYYSGSIVKKTLSFSDNNIISSWARSSVEMMTGMGIFSGKENNRFDPKGNLTNAEAAVIICKVTELINRNELLLPKINGIYKPVKQQLEESGAVYGPWSSSIDLFYSENLYPVDNSTLRVETRLDYRRYPATLKGDEEWSDWFDCREVNQDTWFDDNRYDGISIETAYEQGLIKAEFRKAYSEFYEKEIIQCRIKERVEYYPYRTHYYEKREVLNIIRILIDNPNLMSEMSTFMKTNEKEYRSQK